MPRVFGMKNEIKQNQDNSTQSFGQDKIANIQVSVIQCVSNKGFAEKVSCETKHTI